MKPVIHAFLGFSQSVVVTVCCQLQLADLALALCISPLLDELFMLTTNAPLRSLANPTAINNQLMKNIDRSLITVAKGHFFATQVHSVIGCIYFRGCQTIKFDL